MDITVHCDYDGMVAIERCIPNPRNPNTHPKNQLELLAKIIKTPYVTLRKLINGCVIM